VGAETEHGDSVKMGEYNSFISEQSLFANAELSHAAYDAE